VVKLPESRLEFSFDDNWRVVKWDEHPAYRDPRTFGSSDGTSACDFLGHHAATGVFLIEVKNFTGFHHKNLVKLSSGQLIDMMTEEVRDTIAGVIWVRGRSYDQPPVDALVTETLQALTAKARSIRAVLWVEDLPQLDVRTAGAMAQQISRRLTAWFGIARVIVTSTAIHQRAPLPGLTVRPL